MAYVPLEPITCSSRSFFSSPHQLLLVYNRVARAKFVALFLADRNIATTEKNVSDFLFSKDGEDRHRVRRQRSCYENGARALLKKDKDERSPSGCVSMHCLVRRS